MPICRSTANANDGLCVPCRREKERRKERRKTLPMRILKGIVEFPRFVVDLVRDEISERRRRRHQPRTVEEAVARLLRELGGSEKEEVRRFKSASDFSVQAHFGLGLYIRNEFGLCQGNDALVADCGAQEPDAASGVILSRLWEALRKESTVSSPSSQDSAPGGVPS